jgi:hypothetical protein
MSQPNNDLVFFARLTNLFKRKRKVAKGDLGVYHDTLTFNTMSNAQRSIHYDIYVKVEAVEVYEDLVEVNVIDVKISESVSEDMCNFIKHDNIKYLNPKDVKWQINK